MAAEVNNVITGTYDSVGKSIIYGDTDPAIFSDISYLRKK